MAVPIYIPFLDSAQVSLFSTFSLTFAASSIFDDNHPNRCEVICHCHFDLRFPDDQWYGASFHVPIGPVYVFFEGEKKKEY